MTTNPRMPDTTPAASPKQDSELKPCPFCGAGETHIKPNGRMWTGRGWSEPTSVSVQHWCPPVPGQPSRWLERVGRDEASAIEAWNRRTPSAPATETSPEDVHPSGASALPIGHRWRFKEGNPKDMTWRYVERMPGFDPLIVESEPLYAAPPLPLEAKPC